MASRAVEISLPYNWRPRSYQMPFWSAMESGCKRAVLCWHRRCGKDLASLNWMICASQERVGLYWHMLPSYEQGRKAIWDGKTNDGRRFIDHIPQELIARVRDDQMKVWLRNGSLIQLIGADEPNRLVGSNPVGMNFSEYSVSGNYETCWELMSPILAANNGWAIWQFTPRGRNHAWRLFQRAEKLAKTSDRWFCQRLTIEETRDDSGAPLVGAEILQEERDAGKSEEYIRQEYYCDFDIALVGAYYGSHMALARRENRITRVPWEPSIPVDTGWDLGSSNATCIWFKQQVGAERRLIDFYRKSGEDLTHFAKVLQEKPYIYGKHYGPHDIEVKELSAKQSRKEILRGLGVKITTVPRIEKVSDGIEITRNYLRSCYFDEEKCSEGIQGLLEYVKKETGQKDAQGQPFYSEDPLHNWACLHPYTKVLIRSGACRIMDVPQTGEILTPCGWKQYHSPRITKRDAPLVEVLFRDGLSVRCTPDHKWLTDRGWRFAESLQPDSRILSFSTDSPSISEASSTGTTRRTTSTCLAEAASFIAMLGRTLSERYLRSIISITETAIDLTIESRTWSACQPMSTSGRSALLPQSDLQRELRRLSGTALMRGESGTVARLFGHSPGRSGSASQCGALNAMQSLLGLFAAEAQAASTALRAARVARVSRLDERSEVWCLTVPEAGCFSLENGATVANSDVADSMRTLACGDRIGRYPNRPSAERRRGPSPYARRVAVV